MSDRLISIPIDRIDRNPDQPRKHFDEQSLAELGESMREFGLIEPIVVYERPKGRYMLVAGERRWRAAQLIGMHELNAIVRSCAGEVVALAALVENIQRKDLNHVELAECFARTMAETGLTQHEMSKKIGKSQAHISQLLTLLELDETVRAAVRNGEISYYYVQCLRALKHEDQRQVLRHVLDNDLSPLRMRALVQEKLHGPKPLDVHIRDIEARLSKATGCRVHARFKPDHRGRIYFELNSLDDLDRLIEAVL